MPNERYTTYRGLITDLGKILSIWPFENSTTVLLVYKVKSERPISPKLFLQFGTQKVSKRPLIHGLQNFVRIFLDFERFQ